MEGIIVRLEIIAFVLVIWLALILAELTLIHKTLKDIAAKREGGTTHG